MKVFAAIDLRDGEAVQLVGGDPGDERVRIPDPVAVSRRWLDAGFRHIHVVDLDAALGTGDNGDAIAAIAAAIREPGAGTAGAPYGALDPGAGAASAPGRAPQPGGRERRAESHGARRATLQVGGGIRDDDAVARVLSLGADRAIVGTRAVEDRAWLEAAAARFDGRLVVAADVRGGEVVTRGWTEGTGRDAIAFLRGLDAVPLAGVLVTDVGREGRQEGIDTARFRAVAGATRHPVFAAGGVTTPADLAALTDAGIAGAVLGMALYSGRIDPAAALEHDTAIGRARAGEPDRDTDQETT
jgi:phosphoribosylformimino-5-aminoimidazole carboxamide ribotide isomerase